MMPLPTLHLSQQPAAVRNGGTIRLQNMMQFSECWCFCSCRCWSTSCSCSCCSRCSFRSVRQGTLQQLYFYGMTEWLFFPGSSMFFLHSKFWFAHIKSKTRASSARSRAREATSVPRARGLKRIGTQARCRWGSWIKETFWKNRLPQGGIHRKRYQVLGF